MNLSRISRALLLILFAGSLAACGGGGGGGDPVPDPDPEPQPQPDPQPDPDPDPEDESGADTSLTCAGSTVDVDDTAEYGRTVTGVDILIGPSSVRLPFVKKIRDGGRYGFVNLGADNNYVYTFDNVRLTDDFSEISDVITYYDKDCLLHSRKVFLYTDPMTPQQWHLRSTGSQDAFLDTGVTAARGADINVKEAWASGVSGRGITVAVIDDDIDEKHADLMDNLSAKGTIRYTANATAGHGTSVSGIIAAVGGNLEGVRGVAYNAKLRGVVGYVAGLNSVMNEAYEEILRDSDIRVVNNSWGVTEPYYQSSPARRHLLDDFADNGVVFVKASSNYFASNHGVSRCASYGISCHLPMNVEEDIHPASIVVGAVSADGTHASYSDEGSNLLVSAPGGDITQGSPLELLTTDMSSCSLGDSRSSDNHPFQNGTYAIDGILINPSCDYQNGFSGTSAATPVISGAAALVLSKNPALSVWQVRYALASTARKTTDSDPISRYQGVYVYTGWVDNRAGFSFNNRYGFGLADASAAVAKAASCSNDVRCRIRGNDPVEFVSQGDPVCEDISGGVMLSTGLKCVFRNFYADGANNSGTYDIENITVSLGSTDFQQNQDSAVSVAEYCSGATFAEQTSSLNNRKALAEVQVDAESPSGTRNILKPLYANYYGSKDGTPQRLLSNAFMGEDFHPGDSFTVYLYSTCPLINPLAGGTVTVRAFEK